MIKTWYKYMIKNTLDLLLALGRKRYFADNEKRDLYDIIEQVNRVLGELEKDIEKQAEK